MTAHRMLSVIVPVSKSATDLNELHQSYASSLNGRGWIVQFIYVVDGEQDKHLATLMELKKQDPSVDILHLPHEHGEATALSVGFRHSKGDLIMTLPDIPQVTGDELLKLIEAAQSNDLVVGNRMSESNPPKAPIFERTVRFLLKSRFKDLRSGVRVLHKRVADEVVLYGDQHRFFSLIAEGHGFKVAELDVKTTARSPKPTSMGQKPSLLLDVLAAYFLMRFAKKPFRFFGGFGFGIFAIGALFTAYLIFTRLFLDVPLLDRPAFILSTLLAVLGIQVVMVGLISEIITFAFTKDQRDYRVERIIDEEPK